MYNEYFGFSEAPFSIAPDPRYLFMSERHREALAHLLYGLRVDGGFVLLTGEVGTGKTTICRCLLEQVPGDCDVAFVLNPRLDTVELLATLCDELHVPVPEGAPSVKVLVDTINRHLLEANAADRKTVLIVDEAQNLSNEVLEQLRLLTNLETDRRKLLQIILLGQPELRERLAQPDMRQLAQRVVARYHLEPLSQPEVAAYVAHRLAVAGARRPLFPPAVVDRLYALSGGTPRLINLICDRALLGVYVEGKAAVDLSTLEQAAREVLGTTAGSAPSRSRARHMAAATALALALGAGGATAYRYYLPPATSSDPARPVVQETPSLPDPPAPPATPLQLAAVAPGAPSSEPAPDATLRPGPEGQWLHELLAVRALLDRWGVVAPPIGIDDFCRDAGTHGMACLRRQGGLDELRAMNAPAILALRQPDGPEFFATLLELDGPRARIAMPGEIREVSVDILERQWTRDYTLLWRTPPGWYRTVVQGAQGRDVAWVIRQLDRWEGLDGQRPAGDTFTAEVTRRVRAFQRDHGLPEDGMIGPMTMVRLAALGDGEAPVLAKHAH